MPASNTTLRATHASGTLTATPLKVSTKKGRGFRVRVTNTGGTNPMEISFDSGNKWYPIAKDGEFADDIAFHYFYLRSASGTTFSALMFEG
jgi:hypothetical protein